MELLEKLKKEPILVATAEVLLLIPKLKDILTHQYLALLFIPFFGGYSYNLLLRLSGTRDDISSWATVAFGIVLIVLAYLL